jgi:hypothetical protein
MAGGYSGKADGKDRIKISSRIFQPHRTQRSQRAGNAGGKFFVLLAFFAVELHRCFMPQRVSAAPIRNFPEPGGPVHASRTENIREIRRASNCFPDGKDFEKFAAIAAAIRPDQAWMFVESEFYDTKASRWFENFKEQLKPLGVQGQVCCLTNY